MKNWQFLTSQGGGSWPERILKNRGIIDVASFLSPRLANLRDPLDIPNIVAAAQRVLAAKVRGEKVIIYGDYDVDGVTGTVILLQTCKLLGLDVDHYIPHRYGEGYSLSPDSVKKLAASGAKLIITVDCGVASRPEVELANQLGLEVVITDHHNLPATLPPALAVVNPKLISAEHPSRYLAGAGVAFKFAWALLRLSGNKDSGFLTALLDLVALGTLSDVVPLTAENRILAVGGLNLINERKRIGLNALIEAAGLYSRIGAEQVYFGLAPRLNAAGRLEHANKAVELLLCEDHQAAAELAKELNKINVRRQDIGSSIKEEVFGQLDDEFIAKNKIIILSGHNWHPGVIGIVASQVAEKFNRPTILIGINEGEGRGSARSVNGFNIFQVLNACRDLFLDFGGHEGAAGFEIEPEKINLLKKKILEELAPRLDDAHLIPKIIIDAELQPLEITLNLVKEIEKLAPFGEGNPAPLFMTSRLKLTDFKNVGKNKRHFKGWFSREGLTLETIGFGLGDFANKLDYNKDYDLAFELGSNEFNGFESVQLNLVDVRESERSQP